MNTDKQLYLVRGTGFLIDGTLAVIKEEWGDGFVSITPHNNIVAEPMAIRIHERYLQKVSNRPIYEYEVIIKKINSGVIEEECSKTIDSAVRNVNVENLVLDVYDNLSPILRME